MNFQTEKAAKQLISQKVMKYIFFQALLSSNPGLGGFICNREKQFYLPQEVFTLSPSQLQKRKSAPRNGSRLEKRLGTT